MSLNYLVTAVLVIGWVFYKFIMKRSVVPVSVNYFIHRQCNYSCKFCFHTAKTTFVLPVEEAKRGLRMLQKAGMRKINFSGGEPFFKSLILGQLVEFCKKELKLQSVTIVSNGSLIKEDWFEKYGKYLDIIAISCDSFNSTTLHNIGRFQEGKDHLAQLKRIRSWCKKYKVLFKLNTVVNSQNKDEDMNQYIKELQPYRWKLFQCLLIDGENAGKEAIRDAKEMLVTQEEFINFVQKHKEQNPIAENNEDMKDSYLNLDEYMRFLNCTTGGKIPTKSILDVGVNEALNKAGFDEKAFLRRGGRFQWSKPKSDNYDW